jgi:hypothetical protein
VVSPLHAVAGGGGGSEEELNSSSNTTTSSSTAAGALAKVPQYRWAYKKNLIYHQSPHLRTPNPGFNPGLTPHFYLTNVGDKPPGLTRGLVFWDVGPGFIAMGGMEQNRHLKKFAKVFVYYTLQWVTFFNTKFLH